MVSKKPETRIERDRAGELQIPQGAYWGIQTARARELLAVSGLKPNARLVEAVIMMKKAAALANGECKLLDATLSRTISQVCDEILSGQWRDQFVADALQWGAGAPLNDNVNEVIANRGAEIAGAKIGTYDFLSPQKHVNLSQTVSDIYPNAVRIGVLASLKQLEPILIDLERLLRRKALEFERVIKVGRRHLQDSSPVTLGQEFNCFGSAIERTVRRMKEASASLLELSIGASTQGVAPPTDSGYGKGCLEKLGQITGFKLRAAEDYLRATQSMADFVHVSSAVKELAVELLKMCSDLKLLASGPAAGLGEIRLPEPLFSSAGESESRAAAETATIELLSLTCLQVIGNDTAITLAAQSGQLELNAAMPLIAHNLLGSIDLLKSALSPFNHRCLAGITADAARCLKNFETSSAAQSLLAQLLGKETVESLAREANAEGRRIGDLIVQRKLLTREQLDEALDYRVITRSHGHNGGEGSLNEFSVSTTYGAAAIGERDI